MQDGIALRLNNLITKTKLEMDDCEIDYELHLETDSSESESDFGKVEIVATKDQTNVWGFVQQEPEPPSDAEQQRIEF